MDKVLRKIGLHSGSNSQDNPIEVNTLADDLGIGEDYSYSEEEEKKEREKKFKEMKDEELQEIVRSNYFIYKFYLTHNGSTLYYATNEGKLKSRKVDVPYVISKKITCQKLVRDIHVTKDEHMIFTAGGNSVMLFSLPNLDHLISYRYGLNSSDVVFCTVCCIEKRLVFCGCYSGRLVCWDLQNGDVLPHFRGISAPSDEFEEHGSGEKDTLPHRNVVYQLKIFRKSLFSASQDGTIKQWDLNKGALLSSLRSYTPVLKFGLSHEVDFLKTCKHILISDYQTLEVSQVKFDADESVPRTVTVDSTTKGVKFFDDVTCWTQLEEMNMIIAWDKKLAEIQLIDLKFLSIVWRRKIPGCIFVHNITHDYNSFQFSHELAMDDEKMMEFHKRFFIYFQCKKSMYRIKINRKWLWSLQSQHLTEMEKKFETEQIMKANSVLPPKRKKKKDKEEEGTTNLFQQMLRESRVMYLGLGESSDEEEGEGEDDNFDESDSNDSDEEEKERKRRERARKRRRRRRRRRLIQRGKMAKLKLKGSAAGGEAYKKAGERFFFDNGVIEKKKKFVIQRIRQEDSGNDRRASRNLGRNFGAKIEKKEEETKQ